MLGLRAPNPVEGFEQRKCLIYPDNNFKVIYWDLLQSVCLLITCFLTPFNLAFYDYLETILWYTIFNYVIDGLFAVDILINFNSVIIDDNYVQIDDRKEIAKFYLSGWFFIDFLAVIPFEPIMTWFQGASNDTGNVNSMVRITRVSKLYKLVKITRLIRMFKALKHRKKVMKKVKTVLKTGQEFERLFFFLLILVLMSHFIGCMWIFIAKAIYDKDNGIISWVYLEDNA